eukprot:UN00385
MYKSKIFCKLNFCYLRICCFIPNKVKFHCKIVQFYQNKNHLEDVDLLRRDLHILIYSL